MEYAMEHTSPTSPPHKTILQGWLLQQEHLIALPTPVMGDQDFVLLYSTTYFAHPPSYLDDSVG